MMVMHVAQPINCRDTRRKLRRLRANSGDSVWTPPLLQEFC
jgi:hypothetical protein